jgi:hypothetical protein
MSTTIRDRIGAATGAAFVVLITVGNALDTAGTTQNGHATGAQVLRDVAHQRASGSATVGFVLEVLGFVAFFAFLGYIADVLRRRTPSGERIAAGTAIVAGITMLAIKLGSAAPVVALNLDRKTLTPQLAQLLNDINGGAFVVSWLPFAILIGAMAAALRRAGLVGKPTAVIGYVLAVAGVALTLVGLRDITNGNPMAFLLGLVWLLVVSIRLAVKPAPDAVTATTPSYDASRVPANA